MDSFFTDPSHPFIVGKTTQNDVRRQMDAGSYPEKQVDVIGVKSQKAG
jgi:hypothetical protein